MISSNALETALMLDTLAEFENQWRETGRFSVIRAASSIQAKHLEAGLYIAYADVYGALRRLALHGIVHLDGARWRLGAGSAEAA